MKITKIILTHMLTLLAIISMCYCPTAAKTDIIPSKTVSEDVSDYPDYLDFYSDKDHPLVEITARAESAILGNTGLYHSDYCGRAADTVLYDAAGEKADFRFDVPKAGLYNISLCYKIIKGEFDLSPVEIDVTVDSGTAPDYVWLKSLALDRVWADDGEIDKDEDGNETVPEQKEICNWNTMPLKDFYNEPLYYYFESGTHTITVELLRGSFELYSVSIGNRKDVLSYEDVLKENIANNSEEYFEKIEAEKYSAKSSASILPECDPANAETTPNDPIIQRLNYISGEQYKTAGNWIEWKIDVPCDGIYYIDMRVRQNYNSGLSSMRSLKIDGEYPFKQASEIGFPYSDSWNIQQLGANEPYQFYLTEGEHTIRLTASYGSLSKIAAFSQNIILNLNNLYNSVIMKIGTNPDKYRDYNLGQELKGIDETLSQLYDDTVSLGKMVVSTNNGKTGSAMSTVQTVQTMLKLFKSNPDELALKMNTFKSNIESLAAWANSLNEQPIDIDWIRVYSEKAELPSERLPFIEKIKFDITRLCASFSSEYNLKNDKNGNKDLTVWVSAGRDQLKVLKKLVSKGFEKETGTKVTLAINTDITGAVLAGVGPDICLYMDSGSPVNFAVRDVLVDLTRFDDFEQTAMQFDGIALTPFSSVGGCYALPLTLSWPMLFVRNDIFGDLGLEVPQTWNDMYKVAAVLQRNHLEIGIPSHVGMFFTLLYQNGGTVFNEKLETTFHDEYSLKAFSTWTSYFSEYSFPLTYDFFNRFRSGEMPIGIADYTMYAQLKAAAPEIRGQWNMYLIPGIATENGEINRVMSTSSATGTTQANGLQQGETAAVMFKACDDKKLAWKFMQWFTSESVQTDYGLDIEALLGYTGRYATANKAARARLPWTTDEIEMLNMAAKNVILIDEYPGNYYIAREVNNAFRSVVNEGTNPADILSRKNVLINKELLRKYKQFDIKAGEQAQ